jgi:serine/threonine protein kinase
MARSMPVYPDLDRWRLLCPIGKGAFSTVYRAQDTETPASDDVAIKIMRKLEMNSQQVRIVLRLDAGLPRSFSTVSLADRVTEFQHVQRNRNNAPNEPSELNPIN